MIGRKTGCNCSCCDHFDIYGCFHSETLNLSCFHLPYRHFSFSKEPRTGWSRPTSPFVAQAIIVIPKSGAIQKFGTIIFRPIVILVRCWEKGVIQILYGSRISFPPIGTRHQIPARIDMQSIIGQLRLYAEIVANECSGTRFDRAFLMPEGEINLPTTPGCELMYLFQSHPVIVVFLGRAKSIFVPRPTVVLKKTLLRSHST